MTSFRLGLATACLALSGATTAQAAVDPGGIYRGSTEQGDVCKNGSGSCDVTVKVSADGTSIKKLLILWSARCGGDTRFNESTEFVDFEIPANGKVKISGPYEDPAPGGLTGFHRVKLRATFKQSSSGYTVDGTFKDVVTVSSKDSMAHYKCKTGTVRWSAES